MTTDVVLAASSKVAPVLPKFFRSMPLPPRVGRAVAERISTMEAQSVADFASNLEQYLATSPMRSAAGLNGYRYGHLRPLLPIASAVEDLEWLLRMIVQGQLGDGPLLTLSAARIVAFDKAGPSIRPIQIASVLKRLASKAAAKMELPAIVDRLFEGEHGLATTAGAELMHKSVVMMLQRFDDFGMVIADAEDAFGNVSRAVVSKIVAEEHPSLLPWIGPSLALAHTAVWKDDLGVEHVYRCSRGVLQGDRFLLSFYAFCRIGCSTSWRAK